MTPVSATLSQVTVVMDVISRDVLVSLLTAATMVPATQQRLIVSAIQGGKVTIIIITVKYERTHFHGKMYSPPEVIF